MKIRENERFYEIFKDFKSFFKFFSENLGKNTDNRDYLQIFLEKNIKKLLQIPSVFAIINPIRYFYFKSFIC